MTDWLKRWWKGRSERRALETVTEERLGEMFAHVPDTPGWKATLAVLDLEVQDLCELALDERLSEAQLRWRLGGAAALLAFKKTLLDREAEARMLESEKENQRKETEE